MHQTMTSVATAQAVTTLACTDLGREADFFRDKLGMQVDMVEGMQGYAMVSAGSGTRLMCYQRPSAPNCDVTVATFLVEDIERSVRELRDRGVGFEEYDLPEQGLKTENHIATYRDGSKGAWFKDPAGNVLALTQPSEEAKGMIGGMGM